MPSLMSNYQPSSIIDVLHDRELGRRRSVTVNDNKILFPDIERRLDNTFNDISKCVRALSCAIDAVKWADIQHAVRILFSKMLEMSLSDQACSVNLKRKQEREVFVALGGMHLLLRLFQKPFCEPDARSMSAAFINKNSELWNEVLVILREVCYTIPTLSEQLFGNDYIIFFFSLLVHRSVFENSISILEEILAVRIETFSLALVPNLFSLISKFSVRHLAHFCRVLSLVLFEPEDRQILEGSQVLRSLELLQLRRDRVAKSSSIVERNQCLIIDMPDLLNRFLTLLRVANYGPNLADLARHNINAQDSPGNADLFQFISTSRDNNDDSEWEHLLRLDTIVKKAEASGELSNPNRNCDNDTTTPITGNRNSTRGTSQMNTATGGGIMGIDNRSVSTDMPLDETMAELLAAFAPGADIDGQRPMDLSALLNVVQIAQSLGLTAIAPDGEPIPLPDSDTYPPIGLGTFRDTVTSGGFRRGIYCNPAPPLPPSPTAAKKELQFHAMFLNPHHVELLFVLCTLLSGRRKINVQQKLASLGLADILLDMYGRMSWESKPFHGHNPMEHIHGPGCDCNPESALRVQYLRLVHNSYDRDFLGNSYKVLLLSTAEKELLNRCKSPSEVSLQGFFIGSSDRGIFTRIVHTLLKEPVESVYRFWLSSCLESFLRGSGADEQVFIAISGILSYTVKHIVDMGIRPSATANLQTAFDLLGELVKGNQHTIEMVDSALGETNFSRFMDAVMSNLVDSNVFVRSLYLSIDAFNDSEFLIDSEQSSTQVDQDITATGEGGYLSHSWIQYAPQPICQDAIRMVRENYNNGRAKRPVSNRQRSATEPAQPVSTSPSLGLRSSQRRGNGSPANSAEAAASQALFVSSSGSRITHSVRGALQNIREAASHFLTFTAPAAASYTTAEHLPEGTDIKPAHSKSGGVASAVSTSSTSYQMLDAPLWQDKKDPEAEGECDSDEFFTPPENPYYGRSNRSAESTKKASRGSTGDRPVSAAKTVMCVDVSVAMLNVGLSGGSSSPPHPLHSALRPLSGVSTEADPDTASPSEEFRKSAKSVVHEIPEGLKRFHCFLVQQREYILFRLMITVTMYTINHENICCLNTALLILLLADKRGQSAKLLEDVRYLAEAHGTHMEAVLQPNTNSTTNTTPCSESVNSSTSSPSTSSDSGSGSVWRPSPFPVGRGSNIASTDTFNLGKTEINEANEIYCGGCSDAFMRDPPSSSSAARRMKVMQSDQVPLDFTPNFDMEKSSSDCGNVRNNSACNTSSSSSSSNSSSSSSSSSVSDSRNDKGRDTSSYSGTNGERKKSKGCSRCGNCTEEADSEKSSFVGRNPEVLDPSSTNDETDHSKTHLSKADRVMRNFRELLWYWREYYLRRGRDRLSIEFSSHIPFFQWSLLVDALCKDDGSPTALLSAPIALPKSPYHRPPRVHSSNSPDFVQYVL